MPEPRDARVEVRKERCGVEAHQRQPGRQRVLERRDRLSEDVENLAPALAPVAVAFQEQRRVLEEIIGQKFSPSPVEPPRRPNNQPRSERRSVAVA